MVLGMASPACYTRDRRLGPYAPCYPVMVAHFA
jgi:hypothetical protein